MHVRRKMGCACLSCRCRRSRRRSTTSSRCLRCLPSRPQAFAAPACTRHASPQALATVRLHRGRRRKRSVPCMSFMHAYIHSRLPHRLARAARPPAATTPMWHSCRRAPYTPPVCMVCMQCVRAVQGASRMSHRAHGAALSWSRWRAHRLGAVPWGRRQAACATQHACGKTLWLCWWTSGRSRRRRRPWKLPSTAPPRADTQSAARSQSLPRAWRWRDARVSEAPRAPRRPPQRTAARSRAARASGGHRGGQ
jgi:hypothetical protein